MRTVYKYILEPKEICTIDVPRISIFLSVINQNDGIAAYFLADPDEKEMRQVSFRIAGTGHPILAQNCNHFVGTVKIEDNLIRLYPYQIDILKSFGLNEVEIAKQIKR